MSDRELFMAVLDVPSADRVRFLAEQCVNDPARLGRVAKLLAAHEAAGSFLEQPLDSGPTADFPPSPLAGEGVRSESATANFPGKDERIGSTLAGKYKLIEEIGEGGMGSVFMAQQTEPVKRAVAVKVIKAGMDSKAVLARFEVERQALAMMDHPNIARVLDAGTTDGGRPYFVMELVKGTPITEFCDERKLTPRQRLELFVPVCQAIQHAHQKGVIHRDIKPSNVLVAMYDDKPVPKVIDFGVAKATGQSLTDKTLMTGFGAVVGTPEYMSPEQANLNNLDIDTRSDVYSLGVLLYELLTGSTPVDRKSLGKAALLEILRIVREVEAPRPSAKLSTIDTLAAVAANRGTEPTKLSKLMKGELDWLVLKALEKDRARRYESANGLARDIQRYLADEVVEARPPSTGYRMKKFVRRHKGQVIAASLLLVALLAGVIGTSWGLVEARRQERVAVAAREAEAERADGERRAKELAVAEKDRAVKAEADAAAVLQFVVVRVFAAARPVGAQGGIGLGRDVTVRQALDAAERHIAEDFAKVPRAEVSLRRTLGAAYSEFRDDARASIQYSLALAAARQKLGEDDPYTVWVEIAIAQTLHNRGKTDQACGLLEDVLGRLERRSPRDEPTIGEVVAVLARLYRSNNQKEKARRTEDRVTAAAVEPRHEWIEVKYREVVALGQQERWSEAADTCLRVLDEMKADWQPDYSRIRYDFASGVVSNLNRAGRRVEAMDFGRRMYTECRADYGPYDELTEKLGWCLISVYVETTPTAEHAEFIRDRLKEKTDKWGPGAQALSPDVIFLAYTYSKLGRPADAVTLLESYTAAVPEPKRAEFLNYDNVVAGLSNAYAKVGRRPEAVAVVTDHIERLRRIGLGESRRQTAVFNLADHLGELGEWPAAVRACEDVLAERRKINPPDWRVFSARCKLSWALTGAKRYAEAETELRAGYRGLTDPAYPLPEEVSHYPRLAADELIRLYTKWGKPDEVAKWRAVRAKYPPEQAPPPRPAK